MKTFIALAALAAALVTTPVLAASSVKHQGAPQPTINGYSLEEWQAGAPSPGTDTD